MNWVRDLINYLSDFFKWWVIVLPWQEGIRVRFGRQEKHLINGVYLKLPFIDTVFIQNVRLRYEQMPIVTTTTKDGHVVTINGAIAFSVIDIVKLYHSISNPAATLTGMAMSSICKFINKYPLSDCSLDKVEGAVLFEVEHMGINASIKITGLAVAKTYRVIQDSAWMPLHKDNEI